MGDSERSSRTQARPWGAKWGAVVGGFMAILAVIGLAHDYKTSNADRLTQTIYQPLFTELNAWSLAITSWSPDAIRTDVFDQLQANGEFALLPDSVLSTLDNASVVSDK